MVSPLAQVLSVANRPTAAPNPVNVQTTPVASIYANNDAQKMEQYKSDLAQQNAMWGGLASLGGAGIKAFGPSLFGAGALAPGAYGGPIDGSTYSIGYGGQSMPVYA
jgi:hypothetical protein